MIPSATWKPSDTLWKITLEAPNEAAADCFSNALDEIAGAISAFETVPGGSWQVSGLIEGHPDETHVQALLALAALVAGVEEPDFTLEKMPALDWVRLNQESFPPLHVGRFFIHGSHVAQDVPAGATGLLIDAASAFGTGEHATTAGCLLALDRLSKRWRPNRVLDMGTGTGILAIAAAKTWRIKVLAADLDRNSVRVATENTQDNEVAHLVRCLASDGYSDRLIPENGPYDLIFANILARPLARMAPDLAANLEPGGYAILSGLLAGQERYVHAAHRSQGLIFIGRIPRQGWHTLIYRKS